MRAISTVVDAALFLVLVSAAVGTLALAPAAPPDDLDADGTAELLAASTADVAYDVRSARRTAHGTLSTLLARAAVASATIDGRELSTASDGFERRVRGTVREILPSTAHTQVVGRWRPYPGSPVQGTVSVGTPPPPAVDVQLATVAVPVAGPARPVDDPRADSYEAVAAATADAVVARLTPVGRFRAARHRQTPTSKVLESRLETLAARTGADVTGRLLDRNLSAARDRVASALRRRFAEDMRDRFDSPAGAAEAVTPGTVTVAVRRWGA